MTYTQKKVEKDISESNIEIKLQFPYVVLVVYVHQQLQYLQYYCVWMKMWLLLHFTLCEWQKLLVQDTNIPQGLIKYQKLGRKCHANKSVEAINNIKSITKYSAKMYIKQLNRKTAKCQQLRKNCQMLGRNCNQLGKKHTKKIIETNSN